MESDTSYLGASSMWAYQFAQMQHCAEINGWTKFISMQDHYSLCYREEEREMRPFCKNIGVGLMAWAPLYRGLLARPVQSERTEREEVMRRHPLYTPLSTADIDIISRVQKTAAEKGWKMSQVALTWVVQSGSIPIVGVRNSTMLREAISIRGKVLSPEEMNYIEEPYQSKDIDGHK